MSLCRVTGDKPEVWRDDDQWVCDQVKTCETCHSVWSDRLAEGKNWSDIIRCALLAGEAGPSVTPP